MCLVLVEGRAALFVKALFMLQFVVVNGVVVWLMVMRSVGA